MTVFFFWMSPPQDHYKFSTAFVLKLFKREYCLLLVILLI